MDHLVVLGARLLLFWLSWSWGTPSTLRRDVPGRGMGSEMGGGSDSTLDRSQGLLLAVLPSGVT